MGNLSSEEGLSKTQRKKFTPAPANSLRQIGKHLTRKFPRASGGSPTLPSLVSESFAKMLNLRTDDGTGDKGHGAGTTVNSDW